MTRKEGSILRREKESAVSNVADRFSKIGTDN